jgi:hypothetical protein
LKFLEKVQLALESICGIAETISLERKKFLVPGVDWEEAMAKMEKRRKDKTHGTNEDTEGEKERLQRRLKAKAKAGTHCATRVIVDSSPHCAIRVISS